MTSQKPAGGSMARTVVFVIAPTGEGWGIYLDGFLLEESSDEAGARDSVRLRLDGVRLRGDYGRFVMAKEPPAPIEAALTRPA